MTRGTIRDIRTGRAIGRTASLTDTFIEHVSALANAGETFYIASGPLRHLELVTVVAMLSEHGFKCVRDRQLPPDMLLIFSGTPEELGFAS